MVVVLSASHISGLIPPEQLCQSQRRLLQTVTGYCCLERLDLNTPRISLSLQARFPLYAQDLSDCGSTSDGFKKPFSRFVLCHGRKSTGVTNHINGGCIPFKSASFRARVVHVPALWRGFLARFKGTEALLTGVINHTCAFSKHPL